MKKKIISMLLASLMTLSLVSCSSNSTKDKDSTATGTTTETKKETVTIWAWDPNFNIAIMNEAKALYEAKNPDVEIKVVDFAKADVEQKLHTILASGSKEDLPEVVLIEDYNGQKYLQSYPGAFADLTGKIAHNDFAPYKLQYMTLDKKIYGVPFDSGVAGWYYRKDILEKAGLTAKDLENITWERFAEIAKVVKEKTGTPLISVEPSDLALIRMMINSNGSWYFDKDGKPYFENNADLKKAIKIFTDLVKSGDVLLHSGWTEYVGNFNSGKVASVPTGVWITASVQQEPSQKGLWSLAPIPRLNDTGSVNASNIGGSSWYVLENSKAKDKAIDFMNTIYTNKDFYQTILEKIGAVGTYIPSTTGEAYSKPVEFFGGQTIYSDFSKWMKEIPGVNVGMYTYEAEAMIAAEITQILNGKSIDEAMKSVQQQVEAQIK